ncbi:hypothetical protein IFM47457_07670 [Aspergillus lentulus]|nr:hypothetical protein IFM47457_07670 [Aspergillus lentulus]
MATSALGSRRPEAVTTCTAPRGSSSFRRNKRETILCVIYCEPTVSSLQLHFHSTDRSFSHFPTMGGTDEAGRELQMKQYELSKPFKSLKKLGLEGDCEML